MQLQKIFTELLKRISCTEDSIHSHWQVVEKAYSQKSRHYHNLTHLEEMMACFDTYKNQLQFPDEMLYAIFYHDIIYKSSRKDNELKSAELAVELLTDNTSINKQIVFDMILATKDHLSKGVEDEKWLIDFDLRILAKDWETTKSIANRSGRNTASTLISSTTPGGKRRWNISWKRISSTKPKPSENYLKPRQDKTSRRK